MITGLQKDLIDQTVGSSAHIWIEGQSAFEQQLDRMSSRNVIAGNTDKRQILLDGWEDMLDVVRDQEDIVTAAPIVQGSGYMIGSKENVPVFVNGVRPQSGDDIYRYSEKMVDGEALIGGDVILIGAGLYVEQKLGVGELVRLVIPEKVNGLFG